jgi:predicted dehydrogenase
MKRRAFLSAAAAAAFSGPAQSAGKRYRAAVIGHTGRGDYGHNWDTAWNGFSNIEVVAVADPVEEGRRKAKTASGAAREYADYREMLRREKPDLVAIGPRWLDQRVGMVTAAAEAGAHILMEKPFARSLADADAMVAAVERHRVKVQVGHTARTSRMTLRVKQMVDAGAIGTLLEIRARGKEDRRAGGEDLMVLGAHTFDLMRMFGGDPQWVFAHVTQDGREITPADSRQPSEPIGLVAGNQVAAMFAFPGGVHGYFGSMANDQRGGPRFGVTLCGSRGILYMPLTSVPSAPPYLLRSPSWVSDQGGWERIPVEDESENDRHRANALMVEDLLQAIAQNREPACSARDGRWTIEMVLGVYRSQQSGGRVPFPLPDRQHPLDPA